MSVPSSINVRGLVNNSEESEENCHHYKERKRREKSSFVGRIGNTCMDRQKFKCGTRCCIKSKAALLILYWNVSISILVTHYFDPSTYIHPSLYYDPTITLSKLRIQPDTRKTITPTAFSLLAVLYLFFPLAGCLADTKCGRYKAVICSLWTGLLTMTILAICAGVYLVIIKYLNLGFQFAIVVSLFTFVCMIVVTLLPSYITFSANVIQFGMDQLHDSPSEDSVLFIHWFVFSTSLGVAIANIPSSWIDITRDWTLEFSSTLIALSTILLLGVSLCFARCKRQWFLIDTGSRNPYRLVYRVIKFAAQHKAPIRRSAFTYCEDELPSRMDLAKEKYGGPYTTEQVGDVKAFLGILSILLAIGPTFINEIACNRMLPTIALHLQNNISTTNFHYFKLIEANILQDILNATLILLYLCFLRPFIHRCIPGMLKRIGLGMAMLLISSLCILTIDVIGHIHFSNNVCFFDNDYFASHVDERDNLNISVYYILFPYALSALGYVLFHIAVYEFICSQSPHAMKGMLIGTLFTVKGIFQFIGATVILIPFTSWHSKASFPSCGFVYYLINVVIAVTGLVAYTWVARSYKYRERDEPDNIYRYAEEYYDRDGDDSFDYSSDQDLLNVHTIDS